MRYLIFLLLFSCATKPSQPNICKILKLDNCNNSKRSLSRSAGASLPSVNAAAFSNPAAIALNKGWGIETIEYNKQTQVGLVYGTGRIGGAIASYPNDGTFFGNTAIEDTQNYRSRFLKHKRFKEDKFVLATGANIFGGNKKNGLSLDIGLMWRRHLELEKNFYGAGFSLSLNKILSFGYSQYNDRFYRHFSDSIQRVYDQYGDSSRVYYSEDNYYDYEYKVQNFVYGIKFSNLAFDYIKIITSSDEQEIGDIESNIWNLSYFYQTWIFSYGRRHEKSFKETYDYELEEFVEKEDKNDSFLGAQYAFNSGIMVGGFWNYYLLDELSVGLTYFF